MFLVKTRINARRHSELAHSPPTAQPFLSQSFYAILMTLIDFVAATLGNLETTIPMTVLTLKNSIIQQPLDQFPSNMPKCLIIEIMTL